MILNPWRIDLDLWSQRWCWIKITCKPPIPVATTYAGIWDKNHHWCILFGKRNLVPEPADELFGKSETCSGALEPCCLVLCNGYGSLKSWRCLGSNVSNRNRKINYYWTGHPTAGSRAAIATKPGMLYIAFACTKRPQLLRLVLKVMSQVLSLFGCNIALLFGGCCSRLAFGLFWCQVVYMRSIETRLFHPTSFIRPNIHGRWYLLTWFVSLSSRQNIRESDC